MRPHQFLYLLVAVSFFACKKESLPPVTPPRGPAVFSLISSGIICSTVVSGNYIVGQGLDSSNKIVLQVDVSSPGTYAIFTAVVNGIRFYDSGSFVKKGKQPVILKGSGTPGAADQFGYILEVGSSSCLIKIEFISKALKG